ncbi:hypothetical protein TWF694_010614 [Orbilia ellipsospora]|uniref:Tat pathway signal sequence protein n=1 Tax=Orbilia ellipsospora TaxID=2528407 RepID=A0AAV9XGN6_9PEZI
MLTSVSDVVATQPQQKYNIVPYQSQPPRSKSKLRYRQYYAQDSDSTKALMNHSKEDLNWWGDAERNANDVDSSTGLWQNLSIQACIICLNVSLFIGSAFCYYETFYAKHPFPWYTNKGYNYELRGYSYYSPLLDVVDVPSKIEQINGSLFPGPNPSIYRLPPSPQVDEAWESVSHVAMFGIKASDVVKLGKDPLKAVRIPESLGFPPNTHLAQLDSIHQIHCLNALRKAVFSEYYFDTEKKKPNRLHWIHLSHCAGVLLQNLMCQANLDVITLNWRSTQANPVPDFNVNKKCRDFGVIKKWQEKNMIREEVLEKIVRPKDYVELPPPVQNILDAFQEARTPWDFDWSNM